MSNLCISQRLSSRLAICAAAALVSLTLLACSIQRREDAQTQRTRDPRALQAVELLKLAIACQPHFQVIHRTVEAGETITEVPYSTNEFLGDSDTFRIHKKFEEIFVGEHRSYPGDTQEARYTDIGKMELTDFEGHRASITTV
jgi:hypothetical protein